MADKRTKAFRCKLKLQRCQESHARSAQQAAERAPLLNKLEPLIVDTLRRLDVCDWRGAEYINLRGISFILAYQVGAVGEHPEGSTPAWTYLARDGNIYQWDNRYAYR